MAVAQFCEYLPEGRLRIAAQYYDPLRSSTRAQFLLRNVFVLDTERCGHHMALAVLDGEHPRS